MVDLLAYVDRYPQPDAKIRTSDFQVQGGGNAGNTLTGWGFEYMLILLLLSLFLSSSVLFFPP